MNANGTEAEKQTKRTYTYRLNKRKTNRYFFCKGNKMKKEGKREKGRKTNKLKNNLQLKQKVKKEKPKK